MEKFNVGIYCIKNVINSNFYIGSAKNISSRIGIHKYYLEKGKHHNKHLQYAWNKYGEMAFEFNTLIYCNKKNLLFYEQRLLNLYYGGKTCYNLCPIAGSNLGLKWGRHSDETKRKLSEKLKGRKTWNKGIPFSEESKKKMSEASKGQVAWNKGKTGIYSKETLRKKSESSMGRSAWNKGVPMSEGAKAKLSQSLKGKKAWNKGKTGVYSKESLERMSKSQKERFSSQKRVPISKETRKKMSKARKGKTVSKETKWKISNFMKEKWRKHKETDSKGHLYGYKGKQNESKN